jgi:hypothetical protein
VVVLLLDELQLLHRESEVIQECQNYRTLLIWFLLLATWNVDVSDVQLMSGWKPEILRNTKTGFVKVKPRYNLILMVDIYDCFVSSAAAGVVLMLVLMLRWVLYGVLIHKEIRLLPRHTSRKRHLYSLTHFTETLYHKIWNLCKRRLLNRLRKLHLFDLFDLIILHRLAWQLTSNLEFTIVY